MNGDKHRDNLRIKINRFATASSGMVRMYTWIRKKNDGREKQKLNTMISTSDELNHS